MKFKDDSIDIFGIRSELVLALQICADVYAEDAVDMTITSVNDAQHSRRSLHYIGAAADLSIKGLSSPGQTVYEIRKRLNKHFDVLLESNHIHIEYQREGY